MELRNKPILNFSASEVAHYNEGRNGSIFGLSRIYFSSEMDKNDLITKLEEFCKQFREYEQTYLEYLDLLREIK